MTRRKGRLSRRTYLCLIEHFVIRITARLAAELVCINCNIGALY